jgi:hypothetical protein
MARVPSRSAIVAEAAGIRQRQPNWLAATRVQRSGSSRGSHGNQIEQEREVELVEEKQNPTTPAPERAGGGRNNNGDTAATGGWGARRRAV